MTPAETRAIGLISAILTEVDACRLAKVHVARNRGKSERLLESLEAVEASLRLTLEKETQVPVAHTDTLVKIKATVEEAHVLLQRQSKTLYFKKVSHFMNRVVVHQEFDGITSALQMHMSGMGYWASVPAPAAWNKGSADVALEDDLGAWLRKHKLSQYEAGGMLRERDASACLRRHMTFGGSEESHDSDSGKSKMVSFSPPKAGRDGGSDFDKAWTINANASIKNDTARRIQLKPLCFTALG